MDLGIWCLSILFNCQRFHHAQHDAKGSLPRDEMEFDLLCSLHPQSYQLSGRIRDLENNGILKTITDNSVKNTSESLVAERCNILSWCYTLRGFVLLTLGHLTAPFEY